MGESVGEDRASTRGGAIGSGSSRYIDPKVVLVGRGIVQPGAGGMELRPVGERFELIVKGLASWYVRERD